MARNGVPRSEAPGESVGVSHTDNQEAGVTRFLLRRWRIASTSRINCDSGLSSLEFRCGRNQLEHLRDSSIGFSVGSHGAQVQVTVF